GVPDRWFRDSNGDGKNDLMLDLGPGTVPNDVNNAGQVVGDFGPGYLFRWDNGVMTDLGTLGGPASTTSSATAINDAGQVTGSSVRATYERAIFLWQDGVMHDIGAPVAGYAGASEINQSGQIVGVSSNDGYASLWTPTTPNGTEGSFTSLGALPPDIQYS